MSSELYFPAPLCLCVVPLSSLLSPSGQAFPSSTLPTSTWSILHTCIRLYKSPGAPTVACQIVDLTLVVQSAAKPAPVLCSACDLLLFFSFCLRTFCSPLLRYATIPLTHFYYCLPHLPPSCSPLFLLLLPPRLVILNHNKSSSSSGYNCVKHTRAVTQCVWKIKINELTSFVFLILSNNNVIFPSSFSTCRWKRAVQINSHRHHPLTYIKRVSFKKNFCKVTWTSHKNMLVLAPLIQQNIVMMINKAWAAQVGDESLRW